MRTRHPATSPARISSYTPGVTTRRLLSGAAGTALLLAALAAPERALAQVKKDSTDLARQLGLSTPTMDAIIHLQTVFSGEDFQSLGLSTKDLGLAGMSRDQIRKFVDTGEK